MTATVGTGFEALSIDEVLTHCVELDPAGGQLARAH